jgi:hypothetical protein
MVGQTGQSVSSKSKVMAWMDEYGISAIVV